METGFTSLTATNIQDALGNKLAAGTLEVLPTDTKDRPIAASCGGLLLTEAAAVPIANGAIPGGTEIPISAACSPANLCFRLTLKDANGYTLLKIPLVQTTSAGLNLDTLSIPFAVPLALIQKGDKGDKGDPGTPFGAATITTISILMGSGFVPCNVATGLSSFGTAPTDCTSAINTFLQGATPAAPRWLIFDVGAMVSGQINAAPCAVMITGFGWTTGLYLKDGAGASNNILTNGYTGSFSSLPALGETFIVRDLRINGNRKYYTGTDGSGHYTQGLVLANVHGVRVANVWFYDVCTYAAMFTNCTDIVCQGCRVDSPSNAGNTDGFHFNGYCFDIRVSDCYFNTGDDAIALNSPEVAPGPIARVTITNCVFYNCTTMVRAYTENGGTLGTVSGVVVDNCTATLLKDTANYINCAFLLGFNDISSSKTVDSITDFSASNCTITSNCPVCIFGDPCGTVKLRNITWNANYNNTPAISSVGNGSISYLEVDIKTYRTVSPDGTGGPYLLASGMNGAFATTIGLGAPGGRSGAPDNQIGKMRVLGWDVIDQYGHTYAPAAYVFDMTFLSIAELIIESMSTDRISALFNPFTGGHNIGLMCGKGMLETGFSIPSTVPIANNYPFFNSSGAFSINLAGVNKVFNLT